MGYALQSMLRIRTMREDGARSLLASARAAVARQMKVVEEKRETRLRFEETKEARRDKLYDSIIGQTISQDALESIRAAVAAIDEEGMLLQADEDKARADLKKREEETETARQGYVVAVRDKTKLEEHRRIWMEEDSREQELRSEAELEDFTGRKSTDDELDDIADLDDAI